MMTAVDWLPMGSLAFLAFCLALKNTQKAYRIRLMKREETELRMKQVELEKAYLKLQEENRRLQAEAAAKPKCGIVVG